MRKLLITGGNGQVGRALGKLDWPTDLQITAPGRNVLDLSVPENIKDYLHNESDIFAIINCAAFTAVDKAESETTLAKTLNTDAPGQLAEYANSKCIPIIHISTDYVFDGSNAQGYVETDRTEPLNVYGRTKLEGEAAVLKSGARAIVLRTAWIISADGQNFLKTILRLTEDRDEISIVSDQFGSPTSADDIATTIRSLMLSLLQDPLAPVGIYHFVNSGDASWYDLAKYIIAKRYNGSFISPVIEKITTSEYPTAALRPKYSKLQTAKITKDYDIVPRSWHEAIDQILTNIL